MTRLETAIQFAKLAFGIYFAVMVWLLVFPGSVT